VHVEEYAYYAGADPDHKVRGAISVYLVVKSHTIAKVVFCIVPNYGE